MGDSGSVSEGEDKIEEDLSALIADPMSYLDMADEDYITAPSTSTYENHNRVHMVVAIPDQPTPPVKLSTLSKSRPMGLPDWASGYLNFCGLVPLSQAYFYGIAAFNGAVTDVLLDTEGSGTIMDLASACKLYLSV